MTSIDEIVLAPGEIVPKSGQYEIQGLRGGKTEEERTLVKGNTAPPTYKPKQKLVLVDETKHRRK